MKEIKLDAFQRKKMQVAQQTIQNNTASLISQIGTLRTKCVMEKEDEKILANITMYFNAGGVLSKADNNTAN